MNLTNSQRTALRLIAVGRRTRRIATGRKLTMAQYLETNAVARYLYQTYIAKP